MRFLLEARSLRKSVYCRPQYGDCAFETRMFEETT